jgi:hypothetical protein
MLSFATPIAGAGLADRTIPDSIQGLSTHLCVHLLLVNRVVKGAFRNGIVV